MNGANTIDRDEALLRPIQKTGWKFWAFSAVLVGIWAWGMYAWFTQLDTGLTVTGMNIPVYW
ncbi:MAG: hypothetical protein ACE5H3_01095, partial [Planctomycetota bacterium]